MQLESEQSDEVTLHFRTSQLRKNLKEHQVTNSAATKLIIDIVILPGYLKARKS